MFAIYWKSKCTNAKFYFLMENIYRYFFINLMKSKK